MLAVDAFLSHACLSYGDDDWPSKWRRAERLRVHQPELARADIFCAAASGELERVRSLIGADPALATQRGGPQSWPPLLFVCYGRLPNAQAARNALAIARLLLDAGADPNAQFVMGDGDYRFSALTGAIGHGELEQPEHPQAEALARLLLSRGARPDDAQALYNTQFDDDPRWLALLAQYGLDRDARVNWRTASGEPPRIFDYLLPQAVSRGHARRALWLLDHGADPNARSTYDARSCHQAALVAGHPELARLLLERGATAAPLNGRDAFIAACARDDAAEAERLLDGHRDYLGFVQPLIDAARAGKLETVQLLLRLGVDPNGAGVHGHRALHVACKHRAVTDALFAYGADARSRCFGGSVASWARHAGDLEGARHYAERSRSLLDAALSGHVSLAQELLEANPACVGERSPSGNGPLHELTDDFDRAKALITLLLAHGADTTARNDAGQTAAERLTELGLDPIADALARCAHG